MSPFYRDKYLDPPHLLRKVILLFLLAIALAFGLSILFRENPGYPAWAYELYANVWMAVAAGFGSRFILRNQPGFVRFIAALAAYVAGLHMLGFVSSWEYGMGPIVFWSKTVDYDGLIQLGIGVFVFVLIFRAWTRIKPPMPESAVRPRGSAGKRGKRIRSKAGPALKARFKLPKLSMPTLSWPGWSAPKKPAIKSPRSNGRGRAISRNAQAPLIVRRSANRKPRSAFRRKPQVQLALVEEHRCPYCLEPVARTDPRGVVECEVCHTLHHKDCWEVTGTCQVPHLNA